MLTITKRILHLFFQKCIFNALDLIFYYLFHCSIVSFANTQIFGLVITSTYDFQ